ncbi:hypothetical protein M5X11_08545 [Paenibacillus alginolyticus]|jgi:uncharacterized protein YneF (UPF0154 family)|uniref:General stress protein 17M-like domain-containing protein n=1 Tax=Paenibacillus alginolyticus TaxID=59839 RepID=A0ABT4G848_9BACL|nr:hypothetical protein [Paenibacillus alginolyticus]MCY9665004.1 hypothetical protein [Paenibacillus alginolyticus]MCY9692354.1 hypothetical protein [Paenibacillus alginolyticus]MEC0145805.1 hypothetical protein [Paenibacillus alginolyticus]
MHVIASFEHSIYLELAITALEEAGIPKEHIYAVSLQGKPNKPKMFDTIHRSDGVSLFDAGTALATALTVVGSTYGFILKGGAILWGLIGAAVGFTIGVFIDIAHKKKKKAKTNLPSRNKMTEVVVLVACDKEATKQIQDVFWEHHAFGVAICE